MRSIWTGAVTFGLVSIPVKLYSATESHDVGLHQVHDEDRGRIRYQKVCEACGATVTVDHIHKAVDEGGRTVVLTDEDLAALPVERTREIEVVEFVPREQVDPVRFDRSYYLEPDSRSPKAYVLLRTALQQTDRTAIVKVSLRQRSQLGALRVYGNVLMLQTLLWDDEVRSADFDVLETPVKISDGELALSAQLVDSLASDFTPDKFTDEYQVQLRTLIDAKIEKGDAVDSQSTFGVAAAAPQGGAEVIDLLEALRRSVAQHKHSADEPEEAAEPVRAARKPRAAAAMPQAAEGGAPKKPTTPRRATPQRKAG